jgi:pimeloyl-ACP methyl ester carboxylesterase
VRVARGAGKPRQARWPQDQSFRRGPAANTLHPRADPLFILAGGPGQAASFLGPFAAALTGVRKDRDIVLVDQRGTGRSSPLVCAAFKPDRSLKAALEFDPLPKAAACAQELAAKGVDAAQYTTAAWVADLDAVRAALGYDRINLWGGSYGTRAAQEYLRRHPQRVRSAVLDSVATPAMRSTLDVWPSREVALAAILDGCAAFAGVRRGSSGFEHDTRWNSRRVGFERPGRDARRPADGRLAIDAPHVRARDRRAAALSRTRPSLPRCCPK